MRNIIEFIRAKTTIVVPLEIADNICRDKDDQMVLGTALAAETEVIITGDKDLIVLKHYKHIKIVTPRDFWSLLKNRR
ncbi:MAG: putative toxin-antitoxin system toxin component, PIN family [Elusimicrobia bacterium]|nr:putative toxin-antitoxin system toxin component, PIN family [Elusimicrobiota bacterium]